MSIENTLKILRDARALLAEHYVPWTTDDGRGGHCQLGCLWEAWSWNPCLKQFTEPNGCVERAARALHPELAGCSMERSDGLGRECFDHFDQFPAVYVNNQLGKEAILRVYDAAILDLEIAAAFSAVEKVPVAS